MHEIFVTLPARDIQNENVLYNFLQDKVDLFEKHLSACELLSKYGVNRPISTFLQVMLASLSAL